MAAQAYSEEEKVATVSMAAAGEEENHAIDETPSVAAEAAVEEYRIPGQQRFKLPQKEIDWIMSQKRFVYDDEDPDEYYDRMINDPDRDELYTQQWIEEERQLMQDMAAQYQRNGDHLEKFQRWVSYELETKGYVEVDQAYLDERIRSRKRDRKLIAAMKAVPGFIYDVDDLVKQVEEELALEEESND